MQDRFLHPKEAATLLGLGTSTLAKLRLSGKGPEYFKLGRSVRYTHASLDAWTATRLRHSTSDTGNSAR